MKKIFPNLVTIKIAAEIMGLSASTLRHWDKSGRLKAVTRTGTNGYRLYRISELQKILTSDQKLQHQSQKKALLK
jgi:DNA-binding transcriptional MerR regulator